MPYGDSTGPDGYGPMTGRRRGFCSGSDHPGYLHPGPGMGRGRGFGRGRGSGQGRGMGYSRGRNQGYGRGRGRGRNYDSREYYPEPVYRDEPYYEPKPEDEKNYLERSLEYLDKEIKSIKDRLKELSKKKE